MKRTTLTQPDGRRVDFYGAFDPAPQGYRAPVLVPGKFERRWNPLRREWVLIAAPHQVRPFLPPAASCPLCPSRDGRSSEIPASAFQTAVFANRFPAIPDSRCEVVVYTDQHVGSFADLSQGQINDVLAVWTDRYQRLGSRHDVRYVLIFENRGEAVGVTLHHPHGQIYGYPLIPPVVATELRAARSHLRRRRQCLQCSLIASELETAERVLLADAYMAAYVPRYARWPYEVHVSTVTHYGALADVPARVRKRLGQALQRVARSYDRLFDQPMPYVMVMHQRPTDGRLHPETHLRVEFYPLMRAPGRLKFLAGGECGAGTFVSDGLPEEKAAELRALI